MHSHAGAWERVKRERIHSSVNAYIYSMLSDFLRRRKNDKQRQAGGNIQIPGRD